MASAKSVRFRFSFLGIEYGGMSSVRHSWYCGIRYQHSDSACLQQDLDTDLPKAKA
ncbi:hypothetical protein V8C26DRAFT_428469 [Trichoderma gracile]